MKGKSITADRLVTVRGLVIPSAWEEDGKVTGVSVATYDEEEYFVEGGDHDHLKRLVELVGQETMITGKVRQKGRKSFLTPHRISGNEAESDRI